MDIDEVFWSQIDPLYHLKQASCIRYADGIAQHYMLDGCTDDRSDFRDDLIDGMDAMKASALMFIRFHAIETLLTVLLGSYPHGPIPRFAKKFFGSKFNEAVQAVARKEIPPTLGIGGVHEFDKWISAKFWGRIDPQYLLDDDVINFISVQAKLFDRKTIYNAFKHGCRIGRASSKLSIQDENTGEWIPALDLMDGASWVHWEEDKKSKTESVTFGAMSCDPVEDHGAIAVMALLVRALKKIRLATPTNNINIQLPTDIKSGLRIPAHLEVRMTAAQP